MRHAKHRFQLGVKKEHRKALITNLAAALIEHGRIQTTITKAKALRPFVEKVITLAKKAEATEDKAKKLHYRRLAYARMRNLKDAVNLLFDEKVSEFLKRPGGYTRIYKLLPRVGDAAEMALIELVPGDDTGYKKQKKNRGKKAKQAETSDVTVAEETPVVAEVTDEPQASADAEAPVNEPSEEEKK